MNINRHVLWLVLISQVVSAQNDIPIGTWRTHFSYRDATIIAASESGVYCIGANSLFFLNFQDQNLEQIGKIDGLSGSNFSAAVFHPDLNLLVLAYTDGNIDLLSNNIVTNISAIFDDPSTNPKKVNHISFQANLAYLSTEFGVVVIDLIKAEVTEAYRNLGENGESIAVNHGAIYNDSLFLATEVGVIAGSLDPSINLQDVRNWRRYDQNHGIPALTASTIVSSENQLLSTIDYDGVYSYNGNDWSNIYPSSSLQFLFASPNTPILITANDRLITINPSGAVDEIRHPLFSIPRAAVIQNTNLWVADSVNGMVTNATGDFISLFPNGPFSDSTASIHFTGENIVALPPGYDELRTPLGTLLGFYQYHQNQWISYNASNAIETESFPPIKDLIDVCFNTGNQKYYFASFGAGMVEWEPDRELRILDETTPGSTLENIMPGAKSVWISTVTTDPGSMVWAINYGNRNSLHRFDPETDIWTAYQSSFPAGTYPLDLQIAQNNDFWLRLDPSQAGGIWVINPETGVQRYLTNIVNEGGLPSRRVNDLQIDEDGMVWLATEQGVFQYPFPSDILENTPANASPILIDGRPLLANESVNCLMIDGGNRKWIGTNNGLWLVSEQGDEVIHSFNVDNSPLPSNKILDIAVNNINGEVFIVTDLGIVSYRGTATRSSSMQQEDVKIFPNPVDRDFQGLVGISGVVRDAVVKISDLTGQLVKEIRASGGTAVWDISDYQGRRVQSGVYLVFSSSADGNETYIGKIAVIN